MVLFALPDPARRGEIDRIASAGRTTDDAIRPAKLDYLCKHRLFSDPDTAFAEIVKFRWPDGIVRCPTCGSDAVLFHRVAPGSGSAKENHLRRQFSVKIGSLWRTVRSVLISGWLPRGHFVG